MEKRLEIAFWNWEMHMSDMYVFGAEATVTILHSMDGLK